MPVESDTHNIAILQRMYESMLQSRNSSANERDAHRRDCLDALLKFASENVEFYPPGLSQKAWHDIQPIARRDVEREVRALTAHETPEAHGSRRTHRTSGSTGGFLKVPRTLMADIAAKAALYRMSNDNGVDHTLDLAQIRVFDFGIRRNEAQSGDDRRWGMEWLGEERGRRHILSVFNPPQKQVEWLREIGKPLHLNTFASNIIALAEHSAEAGNSMDGIRSVMTAGEPVTAEVRAAVTRVFGCSVIDHLSTAECGVIATQCPSSDVYHVVSEICHVEILRSDGSPCDIGEFGQLTVTPYYNYAFPLIRYQTGDIAAFAEKCPCGQSQPLLCSEIYRPNQFIGLGVDAHWRLPEPHSMEIKRLIGRSQWQLTQVASRSIELEFARTSAEASPDVEAAVKYLKGLVDADVSVTVKEVPAVGRGPGGKFSQIRNTIQ